MRMKPEERKPKVRNEKGGEGKRKREKKKKT